MPNQYTEQDYTSRDSQKDQDWQDNLDTDYIFANEDAEADTQNLQGNSDLANANKERRVNPLGFGGKINRIFQVIFNRLNWLKAHAGGLPPDATTTQKGVVQRITNAVAALGIDTTRYTTIATILHALRNGAIFRATDSRYGVSQRATQADVNTGTENEEFVTPATLKNVRHPSPATVSITGVSPPTWNILTNRFFGGVLHLRISISGNHALQASDTIILGGGAWRIMNITNFDNSVTGLNFGSLSPLTNIVYNANNTQFRLRNALSVNDELNIIAVLA